MNKAILMGNITADPEMKYTQNNMAVVSVSLATNKSYKDKNGIKVEKAEFHNLVAWDKRAEFFAKYVKKGTKLLVEWEIQTRSWEKDDWTKAYKTEILVQNVEFAGSKKTGNNDQDEFSKSDKAHWIDNWDDEISVEDLPF